MKKRFNAIVNAYKRHRATVDALKAQAAKIEREYIAAKGIMNPGNEIPAASWMIDDEAVFETMMNDIGAELDALETYKAEQALRAAENEIIYFGLELMPGYLSKERKTLEDVCFGLNGHYVHLDKREKMIEYTIQLDIRTVK